MQKVGLVLLLCLSTFSAAGCTAPPAPGENAPVLELSVTPEPTLRDLELEARVVFENTADRGLTVDVPEGCLALDVFTRAPGGTALFWEDTDPPDCNGAGTVIRIHPGQTREFGPFVFTPGEYRQGEEHLFAPGEYTVEAEFRGQPAWETGVNATFTIVEGELPEIEILPEKMEWPQGEAVNITARLVNTAPVAFRYTSRNGCQDIEVRILGPDTRLWPEDGPYPCPEAITEYTLEPDEEMSTTVVWDGSANGTGGPPYMPAGRYLLGAELGAVDEEWQTATNRRVTILEREE